MRGMGNIQDYSIQCVLVINIFNEKIFILLWFWYLVLVLLTILSFFYWFIISFVPNLQRNFISNHLELSELPFDPEGNWRALKRLLI